MKNETEFANQDEEISKGMDYKKMWNKLKNRVDHLRHVYKKLSDNTVETADRVAIHTDGKIELTCNYYHLMCEANVYSGASQANNNIWKEMRRLEKECKEKKDEQ